MEDNGDAFMQIGIRIPFCQNRCQIYNKKFIFILSLNADLFSRIRSETLTDAHFCSMLPERTWQKKITKHGSTNN
jgi:hypothetical protein